MKKKILLGIGLGFVAVILIVLIVAAFFLGDVIKAGVNTIGPKVTQTAFSVDAVHVMPLFGSVSLNDFVIGNPEGYTGTNAISVGKVAVSAAPFSVLSDKIVVKSIEVRSPEINFEGNPLGANNLKKIMDNVNAFTGATAKPTDTNASAQTGAAKPAKKLEVDDFLITDAKVHFNGTTLSLPDIHLTNLGQGPDGITPAALVKEVLGQISTATLKAVAGSASDAGKAIGGEASKLGKSIGGLFKK
ncbi:MAG: AsmA family protein [Verrucomicrobiota bacterium]